MKRRVSRPMETVVGWLDRKRVALVNISWHIQPSYRSADACYNPVKTDTTDGDRSGGESLSEQLPDWYLRQAQPCIVCKKTWPKTERYYYKTGYGSLRSTCKFCCQKQAHERRVIKVKAKYAV